MTITQKGYEWLNHEPGPKELLEAIALFGTKEVPGKGNNREIIGWAKETHNVYPGDDVAWCGLLKAVCAKRAGWDYHPNGNGLWARNWLDWGVPVKVAMLGDTLIFPRGEGGHVTFYIGEDDEYYHCLGGNQQDQVNITRKPKKPILGIRRAPWKIAQPPNVRQVFLSTKGAPVSTKEN